MPQEGPTVKAGQLVRIKHASVGAPAGSIGLIVKVLVAENAGIYAIQMVGGPFAGRKFKRLGSHLEVISG